MVQSDKVEASHVKNAADMEFEQKDENGKEILQVNGTKFIVREDDVAPKAQFIKSVVQNKMFKIPQIEFDHSAEMEGFT